MSSKRPQVVVIGGGFGGLAAVKALKRRPVDVLLIDRRNFHLFQPLLYQVATATLSPANIATPLRAILRRQTNCQVLMGSVQSIDADARQLKLRDGPTIPYDALIVAAGASHSYFGHDDWERFAPDSKQSRMQPRFAPRCFQPLSRPSKRAMRLNDGGC